MSQLSYSYACILGSHPEISFAELKAVCKNLGITLTKLSFTQHVAFIETAVAIDAAVLMERLGGTVKIIEMIGVFDEEKMMSWLEGQMSTETKFHFGFSVYALDESVHTESYVRTLHTLGLSMKRAFKSSGVSARFVASQEPALSSVIVHKERLLKNGVEIVLFKGRVNEQEELLYGKTLAVQPFQAFSKRDYGRPSRDFRSGMLPPKLARMMVNISMPEKTHTILDPFCGSGTIVQEALLMGYEHVIGGDISSKAIRDTEKNLEWMKLLKVPLHIVDAGRLLEQKIVEPGSIDRIIFEGFLGKPTPHVNQLSGILNELNALYSRIFPVLSELLTHDGVIVAALPFWQIQENTTHLEIQRILKKSNLQLNQKRLFYRRPHSVVGREICILTHPKNKA